LKRVLIFIYYNNVSRIIKNVGKHNDAEKGKNSYDNMRAYYIRIVLQ
jgi:hypothetical protein